MNHSCRPIPALLGTGRAAARTTLNSWSPFRDPYDDHNAQIGAATLLEHKLSQLGFLRTPESHQHPRTSRALKSSKTSVDPCRTTENMASHREPRPSIRTPRRYIKRALRCASQHPFQNASSLCTGGRWEESRWNDARPALSRSMLNLHGCRCADRQGRVSAFRDYQHAPIRYWGRHAI